MINYTSSRLIKLLALPERNGTVYRHQFFFLNNSIFSWLLKILSRSILRVPSKSNTRFYNGNSSWDWRANNERANGTRATLSGYWEDFNNYEGSPLRCSSTNNDGRFENKRHVTLCDVRASSCIISGHFACSPLFCWNFRRFLYGCNVNIWGYVLLRTSHI